MTSWTPANKANEAWLEKSKSAEPWTDVSKQSEPWTDHQRGKTVFSALVFSRVLYLGQRVFDLGNSNVGLEGWYINPTNVEAWTPS